MQLGSSSSEESLLSCGGVSWLGSDVLGAGVVSGSASLVGLNLGWFVAVINVVWFGQ